VPEDNCLSLIQMLGMNKSSDAFLAFLVADILNLATSFNFVS